MRWVVVLAIFVVGCNLVSPLNRTDPRFQACGGSDDNAEAAFPFLARDYRQHFPRMGRSPELEIDAPAFAVVFVEAFDPPRLGGPLRVGVERARSEPNGRWVCVYVGMPPNGTPNLYGGVDTTGMTP